MITGHIALCFMCDDSTVEEESKVSLAMSVFYKFKSALTYDTIQFDDLHISLQEFKKAVIQQKQLGKNTNFDLQVTNAETNEGSLSYSCLKFICVEP